MVARLLFPKGRALAHTDRFLMPTTSRVDYRFGPDWHFIITSQCTPVEEDVTDVYTVITFHAGRLGWLVRRYFEPLSRRIIRQDLDVLKAQTDDIRRFGARRFTSVSSDLVGPQIERLWKDAPPAGRGRPAPRGRGGARGPRRRPAVLRPWPDRAGGSRCSSRWPALALAALAFRHGQNVGGRIGGPISWPKLLWLAYTIAAWFVVAFAFSRSARVSAALRRVYTLAPRELHRARAARSCT